MHPAFTAFLAHLEVIQKSPLTIRRYGDVLRDLDSFVDHADPAKLTTDVLLRFASARRHDGRPRAPAGVNLRVAVLKAAFSFFVDRGLVTTNPASRLVGVREPRRIPKFLTTAEVTQLVLHVANRRSANRTRDLAMVVVLWQTALRVSELARLTWRQVDLERRALCDVVVKGGHLFDVAMNEETIAVLCTLRWKAHDSDTIFARADGRRLSVRGIESLFATWRAELGWTRPLHPHVLRHTHATGALALGTDIATIADLLRHSGLRSVMVYAAVQDHARRTALAKLGSLVPKAALPGSPASGSPEKPPENTTCVEEPFYEAGEAA